MNEMTAGLGPTALLLCILAVLLGGVVQGFFGYGLGLLALPALAVVEPRSLPQVILFLGFPSVAWLVFHERHSVVFDGVRPLLVGRVLGTGVGVVALLSLTEDVLTVGFGLATIVMVLGTAISKVSIELNPRSNLIAGVCSGVMGTTAGVGGTPIAMLYSRRLASEMRSTLSVVLLLGATMSLIGVAVVGRIRVADLVLTMWCFPALVAGMSLSGRLAGRVTPSTFRGLLLIVSAVNGLIVIALAVS